MKEEKGFTEVTFKVADEKLGSVLRLLDGKVYDLHHRLLKMETVSIPEKKLNSLPATVKDKLPGTAIERMRVALDNMKHQGVKEFRAHDLATTSKATRSHCSTALATTLIEEKRVKRISPGLYTHGK